MKTVKTVKNSLKFKASTKDNAITVRLGVKKLVVPVEVRMLNGEGYLFLSIPATSEIYKIEGGDLRAMSPDEAADEAYTALNPGRRRRRGKKSDGGVAMTPELEAALKAVPAGYKLGYDKTGAPRLVRTRTRRKKNG